MGRFAWIAVTLGAACLWTSCAAAPRTRAWAPAPASLAEALAAPQQVSATASVPPSTPDLGLGLELQAYPAGVIAGLRAEWALGERDALTARLAWNETDRGDWGEHDDEEGGGAGGGVGWRRFLGPERSGWLWGARVDLWALEVDWTDDPPAAAQGRTDVLVLQPTLEGGYRWRMERSRWSVDVTGSFGFEINVDTDGQDVGEGAIGLLGVTLLYGL